jgi:hypothetical protein
MGTPINDNQSLSSDSAYARNRRLQALINEAVLSVDVLSELIPEGDPHLFEKVLWDYKQKTPSLSADRRPSDEERRDFNAAIAEILKDVVAFTILSVATYSLESPTRRNRLLVQKELSTVEIFKRKSWEPQGAILICISNF